MTTGSTAERAALLAEGNRLFAEQQALSATDPETAADLGDRYSDLVDSYLELLAEVPLARSPHTGEVVRWRIDTAGLDGWFWRRHTSERDDPEPMPAGWLAMHGAMRLVEPVERTPFQVVPGPGVPYVVPRLLEVPGVRAVVSQVPVGRHTGWAVTYFGANPDNVELVNTWGSDTYYVYDESGTWVGWHQSTDRVSDYDFELEPWLRSGKLLWIAPDDESATLREGAEDCPYRDLEGPRRIAHIQNGEIEYGPAA
ncbi:hypothetical protein ACTMTJ_44835 [Phytohabitans sp. LJ34]|uniref:hypothetical protein n=1 Tax=Phytohabitans sp. LJ34 TaxID=3452217 RepID=UPI003F8974CB